jgi:hypothetical protein
MKLIFLSGIFKKIVKPILEEKENTKPPDLLKCCQCHLNESKPNFFIVGIIVKKKFYAHGQERFCGDVCLVNYINSNFRMLDAYKFLKNLDYKNSHL